MRGAVGVGAELQRPQVVDLERLAPLVEQRAVGPSGEQVVGVDQAITEVADQQVAGQPG
jgi:hypothetical protein